MKIPSTLRLILSGDRRLEACVDLSFAAFEPWLKASGMPFFPDYTDHGPEHVEGVLTTSQALISESAYPHITAADSACLALSVLLHDVAMHLSEDGFVQLVCREETLDGTSNLGDTPWNRLWIEFLGEASRFDGRKLFALFGNTEPVRRPPLVPDQMTKRDRLLIGEFLRRHHHRLAHEIALYGVVGAAGQRLQLVQVEDHLRDIAGLVARSHGLPLRTGIEHLQKNYSEREYKRIHPAFLMAVLRIADYLQIHSERAPRELLQVKRLSSPISQREWSAHHAILDIRHTHEDPEALFI